ncbi:MAG: hypothetical protein CMO04_10140 [Thalassospira sp.]|nr:hypothetical protein [Thalassospira sp.]|tara:strand:- start:1018 stop:1197 length:180 start_codon:yes stop_codon:yes gene_type:complete
MFTVTFIALISFYFLIFVRIIMARLPAISITITILAAYWIISRQYHEFETKITANCLYE